MHNPNRHRRSAPGWVVATLLLLALAACGQQPPAQSAGLEIVSAQATSQTSIDVAFNNAVGSGAAEPSNYRVTGPDGSTLEVLAAYPSSDGMRVTLATEPQQLVTYALTIRNLTVAESGAMAADLSAQGGFGGSAESAPFVASAIALSNTELLVTFADPASATPASMSDNALDVRFYEISAPNLEILGAAFANDTDRGRVILTTSSMSDLEYTVKVTNVQDDKRGMLVDPFLNTATFGGIAGNDQAPPTVHGAFATNATTVVVRFSEPVSDDAADPSHYTITYGDADSPDELPVLSVALNDVNTEATLTTMEMTAGVGYSLEIEGVTDANGNALSFTTLEFDGTPVDPTEDQQAPRVLGATSTSNTTVVVTFSEPVAAGDDSATNPAHYSIVDAATMAEGLMQQAIVVVQEAVLSANQRSVTLTTMAQSEVKYSLAVTNVKDLVGNVVVPPDRAHPYQTTFFGSGTQGAPTDTDGDGLSDAEEQYGWTVVVYNADGTTSTRDVTSDPGDSRPGTDPEVNVAAQDTDGDGVTDLDEKTFLLDPRNRDTDGDGLSDAEELEVYYSEPAVQDTDGDGLQDGLEVHDFGTSPVMADTDGDQFDDRYEVLTDNRNPRSADLPKVGIDVGVVDLRLDVRFDEQTATGTRTLDSRDVSTTLSRSQQSAQSSESSSSLDWFVKLGAEVCIKGSCEEADPAGGKFSAEGGVSGSTSTTFTTASTLAAQREYATSLSSSAEVSAESVVTRVVEGAAMAVEVNLSNRSNIAFTISDIEITALLQDPRDPSIMVPVATLFGASGAPISIGPLTPERGPFRFVADNAFPSLVESLMANPRGLVFRIANYDIVDEFGRNFAFVEQDVNDRTMFLEIDYAGNAPVERHQLATNATFDANGKASGIPMAQLLEDVLGLTHVDEAIDKALDPSDRGDADLLDRSYSTRLNDDGVDTLWRIGRVSRELTSLDRDWWVIGPVGNITQVGDRPGQGFRDYRVFADQDFLFAFVQDLDQDDLEAVEETFYRSIDSDVNDLNNACFGSSDGAECDEDEADELADSKDSDRDGIADADEVYGPFEGNRRVRWTIRPEDGTDAYQTMSHPGRVDTDGDGLTDCQELLMHDTCKVITVYEDADGIPTLAPTSSSGASHDEMGTTRLVAPTDPASPDTDGDGLPDAVEVIGFAYVDLDSKDQILTYEDYAGDPYATNPLNPDTDRDGLQDLHELRLGSNPRVQDGDAVRDDDADGLVNAVEIMGWDVTVIDAEGKKVERAVASDPDLEDTDGDGLTDWEEYRGCRDANRDRVCDDDARFSATDPTSSDSDDDGLSDRQEVDGVDFPSDTSTPLRVTDLLSADTDGDGRIDGDEVHEPWIVNVTGRGGYQVWSDPILADADGDGLNDGAELDTTTDPNNADSDGDGALDGLEAHPDRATDPLTPDHLVTVTFLSLHVDKGGESDGGDGDPQDGNPGDFVFEFRVRTPSPSGELQKRVVSDQDTVTVRDCDYLQETHCRDGWGEDVDQNTINLHSTDVFEMQESLSFGVPYTALFTIEGLVEEIDFDEGTFRTDVSYAFGGLGDPVGTYAGSELTKGSFPIAFNQPPNPDYPMEITVLVRVE